MKCESCGVEQENLKRCSVCKAVYYCSKECQNKAWPQHKLICIKPKAENIEILPEPKSRIDDFELLDLIGRGNFTDIFKAVERNTNKIYAVKVAEKTKLIKLHKEDDLFIEKHCLDRLKDIKNVVRLHETFQDQFKLYIVMELLEGKELWELAKIFGLQNKKLVYYYFNRILKVVKEVHDAGIAHRDLKPENIMVNGAEIKLFDFGTAKDIEQKVMSKGNSSTGRKYFEHFIGTPNYMAPECIHNKDSGYASDVYALGVLLYFLIAGYPAIIGGSEYLIFKQALEGPEPFFYDFLFMQEDATLIKRMMDHKAENRPSIQDMIELFTKYDELDYEIICKEVNEMDKFFIEITSEFLKRNDKCDREAVLTFIDENMMEIEGRFEEKYHDKVNRRLKLLSLQLLDHYGLQEFEFREI